MKEIVEKHRIKKLVNIICMNEKGRKLQICKNHFFRHLLPVWYSKTSISWFVDLGIQCFHGGTIAWKAQGNMGALGTLRKMVVMAVRIYAAAVHWWVQWSDASVCVVLIGAERAADNVLDLSIFPLLCLLLPKFLRLGLYSVRDILCTRLYFLFHEPCRQTAYQKYRRFGEIISLRLGLTKKS